MLVNYKFIITDIFPGLKNNSKNTDQKQTNKKQKTKTPAVERARLWIREAGLKTRTPALILVPKNT